MHVQDWLGLTNIATRGSGHQFAQELQSLCHQLAREKIDACYIAAWPAEARDKTKLGRVFGDGDRRNRRTATGSGTLKEIHATRSSESLPSGGSKLDLNQLMRQGMRRSSKDQGAVDDLAGLPPYGGIVSATSTVRQAGGDVLIFVCLAIALMQITPLNAQSVSPAGHYSKRSGGAGEMRVKKSENGWRVFVNAAGVPTSKSRKLRWPSI
jgi:hypothetical protein